jgi:hypothetical protein
MFVNRAIFNDGRLACSRFGVPWNSAGREGDFAKARWELYNLDADFSQADDLAGKNPEKLKELQSLFLEEAKKYGVFPLDPRLAERLDSRNRVAGEPRASWTYYGNNVRHGVEPFEVGRDSISPVNADYKTKGSFPFTGSIEKITFEVTPKS